MKKIKYFGMCMIALMFLFLVLLEGVILLKPFGVTDDIYPTFYWISPEGKSRLIVDDDERFDNPLVDVGVSGNKYQTAYPLDFGTYYWKIEHKNGESYTGMFVLNSKVDINVENDYLKNNGNTEVVVDTITGRHFLDIGEKRELENGENLVSQK